MFETISQPRASHSIQGDKALKAPAPWGAAQCGFSTLLGMSSGCWQVPARGDTGGVLRAEAGRGEEEKAPGMKTITYFVSFITEAAQASEE